MNSSHNSRPSHRRSDLGDQDGQRAVTIGVTELGSAVLGERGPAAATGQAIQYVLGAVQLIIAEATAPAGIE
jgi:hypothetical protein